MENVSEIKNLSEIYKNNPEISSVKEIDEKEAISEGFKMEVVALNVLLGLYNLFIFEDLFNNLHIIKRGSSISKGYMFISSNVSFQEEP